MSMEPNLTEDERNIWKRAYDFHEKWCDVEWNQKRWDKFAEEMGEIDYFFHGHPLMRALLLAVFDYINGQVKDEALMEPEQVRMQL